MIKRLGDPPDLTLLNVEFWNQQTKETAKGLTPLLEEDILTAVDALGTEIPTVWDIAVIHREAIDWAGRYTYELVKGIDDHSMDVLRRLVPDWIETEGATIGDLEKRLAPTFGKSRAESIAITETTRGFSEGQKIVQRELEKGGIRRARKWNTAKTDWVCDICRPLEGKPQDEWGAITEPPAHPRCRCWTTLTRIK